MLLLFETYYCWTSIFDYFKLRMQGCIIFPTAIVKMYSISFFFFCLTDYIYGRTEFGQWFSDNISKFFYCFYWCRCCFVVVVPDFVILLLFYFFIIFLLIYCGFVRYYFLRLLGIPIIHVVHGVWRPFYIVFNICNFSITFFIALSWILFSYLFY